MQVDMYANTARWGNSVVAPGGQGVRAGQDCSRHRRVRTMESLDG